MTGDLPPQDHLPPGNPGEDLGPSEPLASPVLPSTSRSNPTISDADTSASNINLEPCQQEVQSSSQSQAQQAIDDNSDSSYHLKWISWNSSMIPIVMQSINGPCPLIATMNVLLLREKIKLPNMLEQITENQLLAYIGECIMDSVPADAKEDENILLNMEQNINDAIEILPKLKTGLDVNIRFTGITDFEYTPECIIFDLLRIPLYHGWLSDPDLTELQSAIGNQSYNQLVDSIITHKASRDPIVATRVLMAEEFLDRTASQLTQHGLRELGAKIKDNEIGILFRNNHFLTLFKREGEIYTLVTDHGYLTEDNIVWETLDNIEGAGRFFDANFQLSEITNRQMSEMKAIDERQQQMDNDYLIALSMKEEEAKQVQGGALNQRELDDLEVAKRLQAEDDRYYAEMIEKKEQQQQQQQQQSSAMSNRSSNDRQVAIRSEQEAPFFRPQEQASSRPTEPELPTSSGGGGADMPLRESTEHNRTTYAQALATRSIWETDRRTPAEQAESWNEGLTEMARPQSPSAERIGTNQPANQTESHTGHPKADSPQPANTGSRADFISVPQEAPPSSHVAGSSHSQSRHQSASGTNRRSRSEKANKESNCVMQ